MADQDHENLVENILSRLSSAQKRTQLRQTALFFKADPNYGSRVAKGLSLDIKEVERLANMTADERARATEK
jgi:catalase